MFPIPSKFEYQAKQSTLLQCAIFGIPGSGLVLHLAISNIRILVNSSSLSLSVLITTAILLIAAFGSFFLALSSIVMFIKKFRNTIYLEMNEQDMILPYSFALSHRAIIPYRDIMKITETHIGGLLGEIKVAKFINVYTKDRKYIINGVLLPDPEIIEEIKYFLLMQTEETPELLHAGTSELQLSEMPKLSPSPQSGNRIILNFSKRMIDRIHELAEAWVSSNRSENLLLDGDAFLIARCWFYGYSMFDIKDEKTREEISELLGSSLAINGGIEAWNSMLRKRLTCDMCGETYKMENLQICTGCLSYGCYKCSGFHGCKDPMVG